MQVDRESRDQMQLREAVHFSPLHISETLAVMHLSWGSCFDA